MDRFNSLLLLNLLFYLKHNCKLYSFGHIRQFCFCFQRIMDVAEMSALSSSDVDPPKSFEFIDAKNNSINLEYSSHFGGDVNLNMSAVHVPTNVYDRASNVIRAIKWSEELDRTFINNYEHDPSLSWQYFGSATGFMRQYPATNWNIESVDLFDCRTRSWYIEAATSPKDILILMDTSGSMTGIRREIAKHVINNILDTLGNNDFVNIITFSNETKEVKIIDKIKFINLKKRKKI